MGAARVIGSVPCTAFNIAVLYLGPCGASDSIGLFGQVSRIDSALSALR